MTTQDQIRDIVGTTAQDRSGDKLGKVGNVYFDDQTNEPKWVTVNTGLFGMNESFVPLSGADIRDGQLVVGFDKAQVKDAPNVASEGHLSVEEEAELYRYYGLDYGTGDTTGTAGYEQSGRHEYRDGDRTDGQQVSGTDTATTGYADRNQGHDTDGPNTDEAMTRSEERLDVGTETREAGRARLRKHVVTEHQQVEVPVKREELRVEREPITDTNRGSAYDGPAISEEEHEVVLHEERPVVDKEAVAVERVKLGTETVRDTETVGEDVRREEIEIDDDGRTRRN